MTAFSPKSFPTLFRDRWTTSCLAQSIEGIDTDGLCREYDGLMAVAPSRRCYFVRHDGRPRAKRPDNPSEKHLAIALWHLKSLPTHPGVSQLRLLDYEFPLRASRSDSKLGEVDLLGTTDKGRLAVLELKVQSKSKPRADSPIHALMEGLRYAAVVQANQDAIAGEAQDCFAVKLSNDPPIVQILAPEDWWQSWCHMPLPRRTRNVAGSWELAFLELAKRLECRLGITVECAELLDVRLANIRWDDSRPCLPAPPTVAPVNLELGR